MVFSGSIGDIMAFLGYNVLSRIENGFLAGVTGAKQLAATIPELGA
jgi:hypothetical protein